ncbi:MAG: 2-oxoacid:acceptor oxidoreductase family protein, partial [Eggerthellaceae bacterium]
VSSEPIEVHNNILNPDIVIVMDDTLLASTDVMEGMHEDGILIFNTTMTPAEARKAVKAPASMRVATVDASGIAMATIKKDMPNTPIVGALAKVTGLFPLDLVKERLVITFGKKFSQEMIDANLASVERAYQEVQE